MEAIGSSIGELAQQCRSAWHRTISFAEHLAVNPAIQFGAKPDILRLDGQVLQARPLHPQWREHADDLAADWRDNGLEVTLFEHLSRPTAPGTYVLTVRSETLALICTCQSWFDLATGEPVSSISVSVRPIEQHRTSLAGAGPLRHLGVASAPTHEDAWRIVLDWLDRNESFDPDVLDMLGPAMPTLEPNAEEPAEEQSPDGQPRPLLLFGGVSAMAAMVALLFVILAGEHKSDQPAEPSGPLTGAGSSAAEPDHDSGDLLEVRAAPVPTVPEALASDDLRRSEQRPPKALFEVREPDTDVRSEYAAHPSAGSQSVNVAMLPSVKANPLPLPPPSLEASPPTMAVAQIESGPAVTSRQPDVSMNRPALPGRTQVALEVASGSTGGRANQLSAKRSQPVPRAKPSNPAASDFVLVVDAPQTEITSPHTVSAGNRTADMMENAATRPQNRPEARRRGPVPLTPIARPEYAVQVAAVTDPAAAARVWSKTTARFPGLGNLRLRDPAPVEVGDKGRRLLYRVAAGTFEEREAAEATCNKVRARAGECLVVSY
jgi:hypothetical protein